MPSRKNRVALLALAAVSFAGVALSQITTPTVRTLTPVGTAPRINVLPTSGGGGSNPADKLVPATGTVRLAPFQPLASGAALVKLLSQSGVAAMSVGQSHVLTPNAPAAQGSDVELQMISHTGEASVLGRPQGWFYSQVASAEIGGAVAVALKGPRSGQRFLFDFQVCLPVPQVGPTTAIKGKPFVWNFGGEPGVRMTQSAIASDTFVDKPLGQHVLFVWTSPKDYVAPDDVATVVLYPSFDASLKLPAATWFFTGVQVTQIQ